MIEPVGYLIVGIFAIGMAVAFFGADPHSPSSRALSLFFALFGTTLLLNIPASHAIGTANAWLRFFSLAEIAIICTGLEWGHRVGRMQLPASGLDHAPGIIRLAQGFVCVYGIAGAVFPQLRREVWNVIPNAHLLLRPAYYLFSVPFNSALALGAIAYIRVARAGLDPAERLRFLALFLATPFFCTTFFLPWAWKPVGVAIGEVIFLVGAIRYHVVQGQRGQFLARFLSPELTRLVRDRGLLQAMRKDRVEISVVACDLRGFTAFTEQAAPVEVIRVLESYYEAVGAIVAKLGATIKDFAGDGVLVLVGAPIHYGDHIERALRLAVEIRERVGEVLSQWRDLGVGVGVASGWVTVGAMGGGRRLEYAAVGTAVNLAARLCARADAGQVLVDERVAAARGGESFERLETRQLKGFAQPVTIYVVDSNGQAKSARAVAQASDR